jgi:regulator of nucleoside diphosphate kinase
MNFDGGTIMSRKIYVTDADKQKLKKIIDDVIDNKNKEYKELDAELARAEVVGINQLPADVITMNSRVLLLLDGIEEEVSLVYPHEADVSQNMISVLSPVGIAILGYREGDTVEWRIPSGIIKVEVKKVLYQPEAAGNI